MIPAQIHPSIFYAHKCQMNNTKNYEDKEVDNEEAYVVNEDILYTEDTIEENTIILQKMIYQSIKYIFQKILIINLQNWQIEHKWFC